MRIEELLVASTTQWFIKQDGTTQTLVTQLRSKSETTKMGPTIRNIILNPLENVQSYWLFRNSEQVDIFQVTPRPHDP